MTPVAHRVELVYRAGARLRGVVIRRLAVDERDGRWRVRLSARGDPETTRALHDGSRRALRRLGR